MDEISDNSEIMSYAAFNKRYNTLFVQQSQLKPKKESKPKDILSKNPPVKSKEKSSILKCLFCCKRQPSEQALQKHQEICQRRSLKLRKKVMLQKVRSIIVKSRRPIKKKPPPLHKPQKKLPFSCEKCGDRFVSLQTLEMHIKYDHRPRPTCKFCKKVFDCRRKALEHENVCNEEDKLFTRQSLGVVDILCSTKVLTCNKCENYFTSSDLLREHKHMANKRNPISISVENTESKTEKIFFKVCVKHLPEVVFNRVKYPTGENSCQHCQKEFQNEKRLHQHKMFCHVKHNMKVKRKQTLLPKTETLCDLCNVDFATLKKLTKHNLFFHRSKKMTNQSKDTWCITCRKTFLTQVQYQKHFKQHGSPNICPICSRFKHFETAEFLRWHISLVHRKKYCFKCQKAYQLNCAHICRTLILPEQKQDYVTTPDMEIVTIPSDLQETLTPYRDGLFKCYQCADVFTREAYLLEHLIIHTKLTPFLCDKCPKKFSDLTEYTSHLRSVHLMYDENTAFTLCSLKSHLYKVLNVTKCKHCHQMFMGENDLDRHLSEKHRELLSGKVVFKFNNSNSKHKYVFWDIGEDVLLDSNHDEDIEESPIKSSGPPIEKLMSSSCESEMESSTVESHTEPSCIISLEEIENSLLLPLNMPCEEKENKIDAESCLSLKAHLNNIVDISSDSDIAFKNQSHVRKPIPGYERATRDKTKLRRPSRRSYSYTDIQTGRQNKPSSAGTSTSKIKKKGGRPKKLKATKINLQKSATHRDGRPKKRSRNKILESNSDSQTDSDVVSQTKLNRPSTINNTKQKNNDTNTEMATKRKVGRPKKKKKKKRFFNLYPNDSESDRYNGSISMVTLNKPALKEIATSSDASNSTGHSKVFRKEETSQVNPWLSNEFAPIRQANLFRLEAHGKYNRLEKRVAELATNGNKLSSEDTPVTISPRCEICNLHFLDKITFNEHVRSEHVDTTASTLTNLANEDKLDINRNHPRSSAKPPEFIDISTKFFVAPTSDLSNSHKRKQTKPKQLKCSTNSTDTSKGSTPSTDTSKGEPRSKAPKLRDTIRSAKNDKIVKDSVNGQSTPRREYNQPILRHPTPPPISFDPHLPQQFVPPYYFPPTPPFHLIPPPTGFVHVPPPSGRLPFHMLHYHHMRSVAPFRFSKPNGEGNSWHG